VAEREDHPVGRIEAIHTASTAGVPMASAASATLESGRGIRGDRYAAKAGTFSDYPRDHELTLVEAEAVEEFGFAPGETRRNLTTHGVRLNDLVGKRFRVGAALCEGTRLCEPCLHLERLTERPGLARAMAGRGGLRAVILEGGEIHVGDTVQPVSS
jgi:hypothetical protein